MHRIRARQIVILLTGLSLTASCTQPGYSPPNFPFLNAYTTRADSVPRVMDNIDWWRAFKDPVLDRLIEHALTDSLTLALAQERVIEARSLRDSIAPAASLTSSAQVQREQLDGAPATTRSQAGMGFDWLLDFYGVRRAQVDAASARIEVADAELDAARLLLLLNLANAYVDLRHQQTSLQLRHSELRSRRQTLEQIETLASAGAATRIDVVRARALVAETQAGVPAIDAAINSLKSEISLLSGRMPGTPAPDLDRPAALPRINLSPQVGIPSDLLRNRPDIRVAERTYYAALRDVHSATAAQYPQLSLGGTLSLASLGGNRNTDFVFGPALRLPIVPSTAQAAAVTLRESRARQAHTAWRLTVLEAIGDVEGALGAFDASTRGTKAARETVRLYTEARDLIRDSIAQDGATVRDLIDAEQNLAVAHTLLADAQRDMARSYIGLNINLGAGNRYGARPLPDTAPQPVLINAANPAP
jgi:multidrug efflux system outer membrane protein